MSTKRHQGRTEDRAVEAAQMAGGTAGPDGNSWAQQPALPKMKRRMPARTATPARWLVAVQEWVKDTGAKLCIVFEGRDTAGKGGTIKAITERVSPRVFRVVAYLHQASGNGRKCTSSGISRASQQPGRW